MIRAILYHAGGHYTGFSAKGHSGYAEEGSDIVCAAVSSLTITCVNSLEALCGVKAVGPKVRSGALAFDLPAPTDENVHDTDLLMGALGQGLQDLAEQYPENIQFSKEERRK